MISVVKKKWVDWLDRRRVKKAMHHFRKQQAILRGGVQLYAEVLDCYETRIEQADYRLVKLRLSIPVRDRVAVQVLSATFTSLQARTLRGLRLRIRFLPGDLSHVVIAV